MELVIKPFREVARDFRLSVRPTALPADHPLDLAARYLREHLKAGTDDAPAVQAARAALERQLPLLSSA